MKQKNVLLSLLCSFYSLVRMPLREEQSTFLSSYEKWSQNRVLAMELAFLGDVSIPRNHESAITTLLDFREQMKEATMSDLHR